MKEPKLTEEENSLLQKIRTLQEQLFPDALDPTDGLRMKSDRYSWHYRPSHHIASGLLTSEDMRLLAEPGKRLLSVGAFPAYLELLLPELGVPAENIVIADSDAAIASHAGKLQTIVFDMLEKWPQMGTFDRILFPESLCIALSDKLRTESTISPVADLTRHANDPREAELLANVLQESLARLRGGGIIRANGPMSHPNVVKAANTLLQQRGHDVLIDYKRYLLTIRAKN